MVMEAVRTIENLSFNDEARTRPMIRINGHNENGVHFSGTADSEDNLLGGDVDNLIIEVDVRSYDKVLIATLVENFGTGTSLADGDEDVTFSTKVSPLNRASGGAIGNSEFVNSRSATWSGDAGDTFDNRKLDLDLRGISFLRVYAKLKGGFDNGAGVNENNPKFFLTAEFE